MTVRFMGSLPQVSFDPAADGVLRITLAAAGLNAVSSGFGLRSSLDGWRAARLWTPPLRRAVRT